MFNFSLPNYGAMNMPPQQGFPPQTGVPMPQTSMHQQNGSQMVPQYPHPPNSHM